MSWLSSNYEITETATRAWEEAKGVTGEQPADPDCPYCDGACADCTPIDVEEYDRDRIDDR